MRKSLAIWAAFGLVMWCFPVFAQRMVAVTPQLEEHIFVADEISFLKDSSGSIPFSTILHSGDALFQKNQGPGTPQIVQLGIYYWYRVKIKHDSAVNKPFILEFFDQTIDDITAYLPDNQGNYHETRIGDLQPFEHRLFRHKNFELQVDNNNNREQVYYFRIKSSQIADIIIVLRSVTRFVGYALDEYLSFGLFYGMIFIFALYNLIVFFAVRQMQYLYYVLYILSVGLYEMCIDGIAYQYLWPHAIHWNQYAFAVPQLGLSVFTLLFASKLLHVKESLPRVYRLIMAVIALRVIFFLFCWWIKPVWFNYKFLELIPLSVAFGAGIYRFKTGYRPARFFVLGYSFLFTGFMLKFFIMLGYRWLNFGAVSYYSLTLGFILEMFFLSFAIGDKVRLLFIKRERARQEVIKQMTANVLLKDALNQRLEQQVAERTKELVEKNSVIELQNNELNEVNVLLQQQAEEISRMNALLEQDNKSLRTNVEKVTKARVLSASVDFEEFSKIYPDADSCYQFLAQLKWGSAYACKKCGHHHYFAGHQLFSRRCGQCDYEESVLANTLFQNSRIPITKAFYMVFLIYNSKGKISSQKLSDTIGIRQSTCWTYLNRVRTLMEERKKELKQGDEQGWSKLVC
ncbi:7TMR-DISM extracellular 2 [Filimonas lacunae]|uniref:7TMR-DISM extracellular 2 n=1 Tax=Filimonas lacunae TaxID=477680 RepID=A0A173ML66_9BACT|nr:7TM diverse intracellular signaling domain-containing protein [Filimonas lacunae]BAV08216.1 chromosome segregation ATPase [Filimonas lacunae]SIT33060.1 7TMR-DISM extracellular 2 [Filimonas lacunae]